MVCPQLIGYVFFETVFSVAKLSQFQHFGSFRQPSDVINEFAGINGERRGNTHATPSNGVMFLTLEDETGFIQCVIYSTVLEALDHVFSQSSIIVRGKLQVMGNWRGLVVQYAWPINGILGGYEGHASMGGGRDKMIKEVTARG